MQLPFAIFLAAFVGLCFVRSGISTQCWICYQAQSSRDCIIRGFAKRCRPNELCGTEIRASGMKAVITKTCKQKQACISDQYQNAQISNGRSQCGGGRHNSVCRCCCNTDRCNKYQLSCSQSIRNMNKQYKPKCGSLYLPNGYSRCYGTFDRVSLGTRCRFKCRTGYEVEGTKLVSCVRKGMQAEWSNKVPQCRRRPTCGRLLSRSFTNGYVRCSGTSGIATLGTSCVYRCKPRYSMVNQNKRKTIANYEKTVCTMLRDVPRWTKRPPTCIAQMCPVATNLDHGFVKCSDSNRLQSVCTFACFNGYNLVGSEKITCLQKVGFKDWDAPRPICKPKPCPFDTFTKPLLNAECSLLNQFGSVCTITCNQGYYIEEVVRGTSFTSYASTCGLRGNRVDWDLPAPTCKPKQCPLIRSAEGVVYECTNSVQYLSRCTFSCPAPERVLVGIPVVTCTDDGDQSSPAGQWSAKLPRCALKQCPSLDADTTTVDCSNGFIYGSICTFSCKAGFHMVASDGVNVIDSQQPTTTTCALSNGEVAWSNQPPRCEKQRCREITATEGLSVSCDDRGEIGSTCSFECIDGYAISGNPITECSVGASNQIFGRWTSPPPVCHRRSCASISHDESTTDLLCINEFKFESVCTVQCKEGYFMKKSLQTSVIDRVKTTCLLRKEKMIWSDTAPDCQPKTCDAIKSIANGQIKCSNEPFFGAVCEFSCRRGFDRIGSAAISCVDDVSIPDRGQWNATAPACEPKKCPSMSLDESTTIINCDDGNNFGSKCQTRCQPQHFIVDKGTKKNIFTLETNCVLDQNDVMRWQPEPESCSPVSCETPQDPALISTCSEGNKTGSECIFSCPPGYLLRGIVTNRCIQIGQYNAAWGNELPSCTARRCATLASGNNMNKTCTSGNNYNSTCTLRCKPGLGLYMALARGRDVIESGTSLFTCTMNDRNRMSWTGELTRCSTKFCTVLSHPRGGRRGCPKGSRFGASCTFTCFRGYARTGPRVVTCQEGEPNSSRGKWSTAPPTCTRTRVGK